MKQNRLALCMARRRATENGKLLAAVDDRRQIVLEKMGLFAGDEAGKNEDRALHSGLANGDSFFRAGHAEPVGAKFLERLRDLRAAVSVTVALNNAQNFPRGFAFFAWGIHEGANRVQIVLQRIERNFRPN